MRAVPARDVLPVFLNRADALRPPFEGQFVCVRGAESTPNHSGRFARFDRFWGKTALRNVVCAKLFRCANMVAGESIGARHNAFCAENLSAKCICSAHWSLHNSLFHHSFWNFRARFANFCRAVCARALVSHTCRQNALQHVGHRSRARFVRR